MEIKWWKGVLGSLYSIRVCEAAEEAISSLCVLFYDELLQNFKVQ